MEDHVPQTVSSTDLDGRRAVLERGEDVLVVQEPPDVVHRPDLRSRQSVLLRQRDGSKEDCSAFAVALELEHRALGNQGLDEDSAEIQALGGGNRPIAQLDRLPPVAVKHVRAPELGSDRGDVGLQ